MMNLGGSDEVSQMMSTSFASLSEADDYTFVAPGTWWLCRPDLYNMFNGFMKSHPAPQYTFVDGFYLPLGDGTEHTDWHEEGVEGYLQASNGKPIVFVGPGAFRKICFIKFVDFVEIGPYVSSATEVMDIKTRIKRASRAYPKQNVVFLVAAGSIAKIIGIDA